MNQKLSDFFVSSSILSNVLGKRSPEKTTTIYIYCVRTYFDTIEMMLCSVRAQNICVRQDAFLSCAFAKEQPLSNLHDESSAIVFVW